MKKILFLMLTLVALVPHAPAASIPATDVQTANNFSAEIKSAATTSVFVLPHYQKPGLLQQWALKLTQKKWFRKWMQKADDRQKTKDTLGAIALISGILLVVSVFVFPIAGLVLAPTALITGIIGISKNPNKRSFTHALIGLTLGAVYVLLLLVLLAVVLSWANGW